MPFLISPVLTAGTLASRPQPALPADGGLLLRPWRAGDAPAVYEVFQDPPDAPVARPVRRLRGRGR